MAYCKNDDMSLLNTENLCYMRKMRRYLESISVFTHWLGLPNEAIKFALYHFPTNQKRRKCSCINTTLQQ